MKHLLAALAIAIALAACQGYPNPPCDKSQACPPSQPDPHGLKP